MNAFGRWLVPVLAALACVGCSAPSTAPDTAADAETAETAETAESTMQAGATGRPLPGTEALTPPPPDSAADDHVTGLGSLPDGRLTADLALTVSGLTAFAEQVTGSCATMSSEPTLAAVLSDGSTLRVTFGGSGGRLLLTAPGIEVRQTLASPEVTAGAESFRVASDLFTQGTSEHSGRIVLEGTCR